MWKIRINALPRMALLLPLLLVALATQASDYKIGDRLKSGTTQSTTPQKATTKKAPTQAAYKEVGWDDLMPKSWDPMKAITDLKLDQLDDSDPRAIAAMEKLRKMWNDAPSNPEINGKRIRIAGFVVPLEFTKKEVKEFLLVPYFGACIHVPPPPANQIIHVVSDRPVKLKTAMDAVWVNGTIELASSKTDMGDSSYRLRAVKVEEYKAPK